jgi:5-methylcytosine-specific restriction endonuclease McrA
MPFKDPAKKKAYQRDWLAKNPDRHRELSREAMRRWYARHPEVHRERLTAYIRANPERRRAWEAAHRERHPEQRREINRARRAREHGAGERVTAEEWLSLVNEYRGCCAYCRKPCRPQPDHRIPLVRGGPNCISNILPACPRCNQRKGRLTEDEFRARYGLPVWRPTKR